MIEKLLDDSYWDGLEEELRFIEKKHPFVFLPYQEKESYYLGQSVFLEMIESLALSDFLVGFIYYRKDYEPYRDKYHDQLLYKFETSKFVNMILSDLSILKNKIISLIETNRAVRNYEADHFYHDPHYIDNLNKEKNVEKIWLALFTAE